MHGPYHSRQNRSISWWLHVDSLTPFVTRSSAAMILTVCDVQLGGMIWNAIAYIVEGNCNTVKFIDGLAQNCSNSSALAMELLQSCTKPSIYWYHKLHCTDSSRKLTSLWPHKRHPISRPDGRTMGCLLEGFGRKLIALYVTVFVFHQNNSVCKSWNICHNCNERKLGLSCWENLG